MLCQNCNQNEANVHITKIINGEKTEIHLCEECARNKKENNPFGQQIGFNIPLSFNNIFNELFQVMGTSPYYQKETVKCQVCGISIDDFRRSGRVGCGNCYSTFSKDMLPLIKRVHGNIHHTGKVPARTGGALKVKREIDRLKDELKQAIEREEYEKAAKLRDEIRNLENGLDNN